MTRDTQRELTREDFRPIDELLDRRPIPPEAIKRAEEQIAAERAIYRLAQIRKEHGITQAELAREMGVSQGRISHIEGGNVDNLELSTVTKYVEALGGRIRVVADFGDQTLDVA